MYIDKDGQTRIAVTTAANVPQVLSRVRQHYAGLAEEGYLTSVIPTIVPYNYRQLYLWKEALQAKLQGQRVDGYALHVSTNTVDVFAQAAAGDNAALVAADTVGLPRSAIRVMRTGELEAYGDLKDEFSPGIAGGIAITTYFPPPDPDSGTGCTLGLNVKLTYNATHWDALTAAHCTETIGGAGPDGTLMAQGGSWPHYSSSYRIAHEDDDPAWQGCPPDEVDTTVYNHCRYADVSAFEYDGTRVPDSGYVDVTVKLDSMTTKWISKDSTSRRVTGYWSDRPWEGVDLEHVGVAT